MLTEGQVTRWVEGYVRAWQSAKTADIEALFSEDAESHEWPYKTDWIGRDEIVQGWKDREAWQQGGWSFDWEILLINGDTAAIKGTGVYAELGSTTRCIRRLSAAGSRCRRTWPTSRWSVTDGQSPGMTAAGPGINRSPTRPTGLPPISFATRIVGPR